MEAHNYSHNLKKAETFVAISRFSDFDIPRSVLMSLTAVSFEACLQRMREIYRWSSGVHGIVRGLTEMTESGLSAYLLRIYIYQSQL